MKKIINTDVYYCCEQLAHEIEYETVMCYLPHRPFQFTNDSYKAVWLQSDGGHGGLVKANYCPFCGTPIRIDNN